MLPISRRRIFGLLAGFLAPDIRAGAVPSNQRQLFPLAVPRFSPRTQSSATTETAILPVSSSADIPEALEAWLRLPMKPLIDFAELSSAARTDQELFFGSVILEHIRSQTDFEFRYLGGSDPGIARRVLPILLFREFEMAGEVPDLPHIYLLAFCHTRQQARTFRLDRVCGLSTDS